MKVNNITRLLVACLWCCCTLLIAENPYDEKPVEDTRTEPIQTVPSIVEETLVKVSKVRMDERGRNPVGEAEKPDFRKWLDMYAHKRSKDLDITYE